jgi:hypothetical protein
MAPSRVFAFALVLGFAWCTAVAQEPAPDEHATEKAEPALKFPSQVSPQENLANLYPQAGHIGFAVAIVPDPNVPRYRRLFDLNIQAITLGMLDDGYVLDRYAFPWNGKTETEAEKSAFGLMVFRCDGWRGNGCTESKEPGPTDARAPPTRIRAIYFVTDTATWGVATPPLICAVKRIREQLSGVRSAGTNSCASSKVQVPPARVPIGLLKYPGNCSIEGQPNTLVLLGPSFSGAMDSVGQQLDKLLGPEIAELCLVSAFTTVGSNLHVTDRYRTLHYERLALEDGIKLLSLANLAQSFGYFDPDQEAKLRAEAKAKAKAKPEADTKRDFRPRKVAFLTEASTFGYGVCKPPAGTLGVDRERVVAFCAGAQTLYFPSAIADIRYGLDQQRDSKQNDVKAAMEAALPKDFLALDIGAENGSEFPETRQSKLTAASQQLALDRVLDRLDQSDPKMVIVVATDVRDRLFLFDQLRRRLPSALLIDLETDILLAHPDFLHASRGAITVGSANLFVQWGKLFGCEHRPKSDEVTVPVPLASWALDGQGMLANAVSRLDDFDASPSRRPCISQPGVGPRMPILHVVTLNGLHRVSRAFAPRETEGSQAKPAKERRAIRQIDLSIAQWLGVAACVFVIVPWLTLRPVKRRAKLRRLFSRQHLMYAAAITAIGSWVFAMRAAYSGKDPESGFALVYWSITILALAFCGLLQCWKRVGESGPSAGKLPERYRRIIAVFGVFACALAAAPAILRAIPACDTPAALDDELVTRLGLDIGQGLAYYVITAVGVMTVLFTMITLATAACIMTRNNALLNISTPGNEFDLGARVPRFPRIAIAGVVGLIALIAGPSLVAPLDGPRLSIFGPAASTIATFVLVITTLGASILTTVAIHANRRIRTIAGDIGRCVTPKRDCMPNESPAELPGLWPPNGWQPRIFPATPVVVRVSSEIIRDLRRGSRYEGRKRKSWNTLIREFLGKCDGTMNVNDWQHRRAIYALLASEISLYRWFVAGAVLCALASVCAAYLFPLEADNLLMWNLGVLVTHALLAGYVATTFERDGVLSNILCNRPKKAEFSASLFVYAALPFLALGFAIAVSQMPGVVDWGGGVLALLGAIGLSL